MYIPIFGIIGMALLFTILGAVILYLCIRKSLRILLKRLIENIIMYWYVLVLFITTIFVVGNYNDCISLHFTREFNGKNLIFLFWLAIIVFPFFDSFEVFGVSLKKRKEDKEAASYRAKYEQLIAKAENDIKEEEDRHE